MEATFGRSHFAYNTLVRALMTIAVLDSVCILTTKANRLQKYLRRTFFNKYLTEINFIPHVSHRLRCSSLLAMARI